MRHQATYDHTRTLPNPPHIPPRLLSKAIRYWCARRTPVTSLQLFARSPHTSHHFDGFQRNSLASGNLKHLRELHGLMQYARWPPATSDPKYTFAPCPPVHAPLGHFAHSHSKRKILNSLRRDCVTQRHTSRDKSTIPPSHRGYLISRGLFIRYINIGI